MNEDFETTIERIFEMDGRYQEDAYDFIMDALAYTQKKYKRKRHVSGEEMLEGVKDFSMKKFGPMTMAVLEHWGIKSTEDIGNIVFNLVENNVLSKTEEDTLDTFKNGYNFEEVFQQGYRQNLAKKISRMRS